MKTTHGGKRKNVGRKPVADLVAELLQVNPNFYINGKFNENHC